MRAQHHRVLMVFLCLAFGFGLLGVSTTAAAADKDKKKAWAAKKHKKTHHKASKPAAAAAGSTGAAAPAAEADDDEGDDESDAKDDNNTDDTKTKPKAKAASNDKDDKSEDDSSDERRASKDKDDDDDGGSTVVRRKAKRPVMEESGGGGPIALELMAGPRLVHRTFDFNDPLSNHLSSAGKPSGYSLGAAPAPFIDLGFYPAAFATHGLASGIGIIASFEKIVGTKSPDASGAIVSTLAQQYEVGLRGRLPLGEHEVGISATYGKQTFHLNGTDPGPGSTAMPSATVPNVDYTFAGFAADARLHFSPIEIGAHLTTRAVLDTGALNKATVNPGWFSTVKTTTIGAGLSVAYRLTPMFDVVGGLDFMRYAFDFNPTNASAGPPLAGGAVDQYFSGFLALRVLIAGG
jgi:hypothetical protein